MTDGPELGSLHARSVDGAQEVSVQCYSGYRGEETPRCLLTDGRRVEVAEILERWLTPERRCFRVRGTDHGAYVLAQRVDTLAWEIVV